MAEMFVHGAVAAPAFAAAGEATPAAVPATGVPGADPLTEACSAALAAASAKLVAADNIAGSDEATAGSTGTSNVQNLTQAEENHAAELRDPLGQGGSGTTSV
ncbi:hypothetical protein BB737_15005 [Mycobacterium avium subsp. hominissuis]|uniref:Uncharacterized protein n=2 Tax=Mycobacterium TaxID=1763 RepID=A0AA37Q3U2_9MYCO|nr:MULTISPECIES: hypothetical protein [Mycobacterium]APA78399.2 hypothetical protein KV38_24440 [Mycobacterium avium subsp. hominissuis]PBJ65056.1 hypothetical protein BB737_15005 [Mycobacterium avium subsp. hominissuis]GLB86092.1 hypothetical protein SRL2020028_53480 [Mycobacterium kiyosense]